MCHTLATQNHSLGKTVVKRPITDSEKLRLLADWFDIKDSLITNDAKNEVQQDLRRIAYDLEREPSGDKG